MRTKAIFRADKTSIVLEPWKRGDIPPSSFRLRPNLKTIQQGKSNKWRIVRFEALNERFRILILFNDEKEIYRATLGQEVGELVRIVCVREFHASEPGWHCHAVINCSQGVSVWNHREMHRYPPKPEARADFGVSSEDRATALALKFYGVESSGGLL